MRSIDTLIEAGVTKAAMVTTKNDKILEKFQTRQNPLSAKNRG